MKRGRWSSKAGFRKPIKRLWISSQTEKAIIFKALYTNSTIGIV